MKDECGREGMLVLTSIEIGCRSERSKDEEREFEAEGEREDTCT
jgi:hypothetical protein